MDKWIKKIEHIYATEYYYSNVRKNEIMSFAQNGCKRKSLIMQMSQM